MSYRKITILVDCNSEQEKVAIQQMADELSNMRVFNAQQMLGYYPILSKYKEDFYKLFKLATGPSGPMGLVSIDGAKLLTKLSKLSKNGKT